MTFWDKSKLSPVQETYKLVIRSTGEESEILYILNEVTNFKQLGTICDVFVVPKDLVDRLANECGISILRKNEIALVFLLSIVLVIVIAIKVAHGVATHQDQKADLSIH